MRVEKNESIVYEIQFTGNWNNDVEKLLSSTNLLELISSSNKDKILLKPNLVEASPPPITTPLQFVSGVITWLKAYIPSAKIIIGEGCGDISQDTDYVFKELGFAKFAKENKIELIDLNYAPTITKKLPNCTRWQEMHLPKIIYESFLISLPVLKAHSLAEVTLSMKNMLGCAPPKYYCAGSWKKSAFHSQIHEAIFELNLYRKPDFTILDATIGMSEAHLWGPTCEPPVGKILASQDVVAIDSYGAELLQRDWTKIKYIKLADGILGNASKKKIIKVQNPTN